MNIDKKHIMWGTGGLLTIALGVLGIRALRKKRATTPAATPAATTTE